MGLFDWLFNKEKKGVETVSLTVHNEELSRLNKDLTEWKTRYETQENLVRQKDIQIKELMDKLLHNYEALKTAQKFKDYGVEDLAQNKILAYLNEVGSYASPSVLKEYLGLAPDTIGRKLALMEKNGLLRKIGRGRTTHYKLK